MDNILLSYLIATLFNFELRKKKVIRTTDVGLKKKKQQQENHSLAQLCG